MFKNGNRDTRKTFFIVFYDIALNIMVEVILDRRLMLLFWCFFSNFEHLVDYEIVKN